MTKTLTKIGNSYGLLIDRPILDLLGIKADTPLKVTVQDGGLLVRPITETEAGHIDRVRKSASKMAAVHRDTLKRLAE